MYTSFFNRESTSIYIVVGTQGMNNHNFFYVKFAICDPRLSNKYKLAKQNIIPLQFASFGQQKQACISTLSCLSDCFFHN